MEQRHEYHLGDRNEKKKSSKKRRRELLDLRFKKNRERKSEKKTVTKTDHFP